VVHYFALYYALFERNLSPYYFEGRYTSYYCGPCKLRLTRRAYTFLRGVVFHQSLDKTLYQSTFATLSIFKEFTPTFCTKNLDRFYRPLRIRLCHFLIYIYNIVAYRFNNKRLFALHALLWVKENRS